LSRETTDAFSRNNRGQLRRTAPIFVRSSPNFLRAPSLQPCAREHLRLRRSPRIDLFKQSNPLPPELALGPGQYNAEIDARLCIECRKVRIDSKPPRPPRGTL